MSANHAPLRARWLLPVLMAGLPLTAAAQDPDAQDVVVDEGDQSTDPPATEDPAFVAGPDEQVGADIELDPGDDFFWQARFTSSIYATDNQDFRPLDESTRQSIRDTDDRRDFGHADVLFNLAYRPATPVVFNLAVKYDALWAQEKLGRAAGSTGDLNIYELSVDAAMLDTDAFDFVLTVGRQPFEIGGLPRDYMLAGTLDAVTAVADFGVGGKLRVLALDFFAGNDLPETGYLSYRDGQSPIEGFRGDNYTLRTGAIYEYAREAFPIEARAYYFYASIGAGPAEESGADVTRGGANGNYSDADYQHMMGLRAAYVHDFAGGGNVRVYGEFAASQGIDRKPEEAFDVETIGNAYGVGVDLNWQANDDITLLFGAEYYHFDGSRYASDGLEFERGFVGFKGARIGGRTVGRQSAWRPASHVDAEGVVNRPHDIKRVGGTDVTFARLGIEAWDVRLTFDWWLLGDTASTFLDVDNLDDLPEPPFGYTREEFEAQERVGLDLGQAIDLRVSVPVAEIVRLEGGYSLFMPGAYYNIEVDRIAGGEDTALGGQETFWVVDAGMSVTF